MTRSEVLRRALASAIDTERQFLQAIAHCKEPSDDEARKFSELLIRRYRQELKRLEAH